MPAQARRRCADHSRCRDRPSSARSIALAGRDLSRPDPMPRRSVLTEAQHAELFALPESEPDLVRYWTLSSADLRVFTSRRRPHNRLGFALQLCALRYPGRLLKPGEFIPDAPLRGHYTKVCFTYAKGELLANTAAVHHAARSDEGVRSGRSWPGSGRFSTFQR
ncbi:DUF4158 domain-containing protein [Sphingomonas montanisoli]|uniref:DUF4158 domain-containing protein n=1 Tax=Sphingomonas montanisoli TaxID=2606412 RepID=A0A5D9C3A1_9SPHN|nr:DUF4158 domain-containing protein [Sphingomonas montanisoli]